MTGGIPYWLRRTACIALLALAALAPAACREQTATTAVPAEAVGFLDTLEHRTFRWFWDLADSTTGLTPDRWPTRSFSSIGAMGFGLTAYPIGAERGWVSRAAARERVLKTLRFLWGAPQDSSRSGIAGHRGFFYHFVDPGTGLRFERVELSTVDTALLLGGVLFCQSYFDGADPDEAAIRAVAESLYARVDWRWAQPRPPGIALGWKPEEGFLQWDWGGYSEAMLVYILALGSPSHPVEPAAWNAWTRSYRWGQLGGEPHVGFAPLFGHQYSHVWIDFRGIRDAYMRERDIDYFENSRRATYAQRNYAIHNPMAWAGYGPFVWGLTACDGPADTTVILEGRPRELHTYWARGASFTEVRDDGTLAPTAAGGSIAFAPEIAIPALLAMRDTYGEALFSTYGFVDAFNPTLAVPIPLRHGRVVPGHGWFDTDYLGIDQGPILAMIENLRSGLVWDRTRRNPHIVRGLRRAGFTGGWLDRAAR